MFKTDPGSLEELSFSLDERDVANLKATLNFLESKKFLTISPAQFQQALRGLNEIGGLKMKGKVYGFQVHDTYAERQGGVDECVGVELYLRQGNGLKEFYVPGSRDFTYPIDMAAEFLKKRKISTIYTGELPLEEGGFLGLSRIRDKEDPIITTALGDNDIEEFKFYEIQVIRLDALI